MRNWCLMIALLCLLSSSLFPQTQVRRIQDKVIYFDGNGITGQSPQSSRESLAITAGHFAYSMKKVVTLNGRFHHLFAGRDILAGPNQIWIRSSQDGISWENRVQVSADSLNDRAPFYPILAGYDNGAGGMLAAIWCEVIGVDCQIRCAVSSDGGQSWGPSNIISDMSGRDFAMADVAISPDGVINVAWVGRTPSNRYTEVYFTQSSDNGITWSPQQEIYTISRPFNFPVQLVAGSNNKLLMTISEDQGFVANLVTRISLDGGINWFTATSITSYPPSNPSTRLHYLMTDEQDNIYALFNYHNGASDADSTRYLIKTGNDWGASWSSEYRISDREMLYKIATTNYVNLYPTLARTASGRLYAAWADARIDPDAGTWGVFLSYSDDNGQSWSPDLRVDEANLNGSNTRAVVVSVNSGSTGDTVLVTWTSVYEIPVGIEEPLAASVKTFQLHQNYPNPFNPSTRIAFSLNKEALVKLSVFDLMGTEVAVLLNEKRASGEHSVDFSMNNLPSGIYFYRLESKGRSEVRRMHLVR